MNTIEVVAGGNGVIEVLIPGPQGPAGPEGPGVVSGGTAGQMLVKASGDDYDTAWVTVPQNLSLASEAEAIAGSSESAVMTPARATDHFEARLTSGLDSSSQVLALSAAAGKALADGKVPTSRTLTAGTGLSGGGDLGADRSLAVVFASQGEATGGSAAAVVMSPLRVKNAIDARIYNGLDSASTTFALSAAAGKALADGKVPISRTLTAGTGLSGGGDLSANRALAVSFASQEQAEAGSSAAVVMSPLRTAQAIAASLASAGRFAQLVQTVSEATIDCSAGNYFRKTVSGDLTLAVANVPADRSYSFVLKLVHQAGAITWFAGVLWPGGTPPVLQSGKVHLLQFHTDDGGSSWYGSAQANYAA